MESFDDARGLDVDDDVYKSPRKWDTSKWMLLGRMSLLLFRIDIREIACGLIFPELPLQTYKL